MSETKFTLTRIIQCAKCPWKQDTNPHEIPHGYSCDLHRGLANTIATPGTIFSTSTMRAMACHHSKPGKEEYCVGWLHNQLGPGNNIALRLKMISCQNIGEIMVVGPQHEKFEDTLPK